MLRCGPAIGIPGAERLDVFAAGAGAEPGLRAARAVTGGSAASGRRGALRLSETWKGNA